MSRTDISAQESQELPKVVRSLLDEIPSAILNVPQTAVDMFTATAPNPQAVNLATMESTGKDWLLYKHYAEGCHSYRKLQRLLRIWEAKLDPIVQWWTAGLLTTEGFTAEEIRNLIWALFEHSDKREDAIAMITRTV